MFVFCYLQPTLQTSAFLQLRREGTTSRTVTCSLILSCLGCMRLPVYDKLHPYDGKNKRQSHFDWYIHEVTRAHNEGRAGTGFHSYCMLRLPVTVSCNISALSCFLCSHSTRKWNAKCQFSCFRKQLLQRLSDSARNQATVISPSKISDTISPSSSAYQHDNPFHAVRPLPLVYWVTLRTVDGWNGDSMQYMSIFSPEWTGTKVQKVRCAFFRIFFFSRAVKYAYLEGTVQGVGGKMHLTLLQL